MLCTYRFCRSDGHNNQPGNASAGSPSSAVSAASFAIMPRLSSMRQDIRPHTPLHLTLKLCTPSKLATAILVHAVLHV